MVVVFFFFFAFKIIIFFLFFVNYRFLNPNENFPTPLMTLKNMFFFLHCHIDTSDYLLMNVLEDMEHIYFKVAFLIDIQHKKEINKFVWNDLQYFEVVFELKGRLKHSYYLDNA
jgi:hypothetical protein